MVCFFFSRCFQFFFSGRCSLSLWARLRKDPFKKRIEESEESEESTVKVIEFGERAAYLWKFEVVVPTVWSMVPTVFLLNCLLRTVESFGSTHSPCDSRDETWITWHAQHARLTGLSSIQSIRSISTCHRVQLGQSVTTSPYATVSST